MSGRLVRIPSAELQLGMFVAELDRDWLDTPFLVQGFNVCTEDELGTLRELCEYVYIDLGLARPIARDAYRGAGDEMKRRAVARLFPERRLTSYRDTVSFDDEIGRASGIYNDYERMVTRLYDGFRADQRIDLSEVSETVDRVIDSVMRNPDACMLLTELRRKDDYTYNHAIGSSIWAAALGRQLGLPIADIKDLVTGMLLCDVGKLNISSRILTKPGALNEAETRIMRSHVAKGLEIVEQVDGCNDTIRQIVACHHERFNGKGYPAGLQGETIPVFARIAGIIDCYDAMINDKSYARGVAPADAIARIYTMRDVDFQAELVEEFIQTLGLYPAGSLVELTNGEVGVVVAEHRKRRLRPKILLLLDANKEPLQDTRYLNLLTQTEDADGRPLDILKGLHPGEYGINAEDLFL